MNRTWLWSCAAALAIVAAASLIIAQEKAGAGAKQKTRQKAATPEAPATAAAPAAAARPEDEQAIRAAAQAFAKAFETGDDKAVVALFTQEAEYIDESGEPVKGREALAKAYGDFFAKRKELKAEAKTDAVRFLGSDTAIEEGTFIVTAAGSPPDSSR